MVQSGDEPFSVYGLLAETIRFPQANTWVEFDLRPEARWHDGKPVTAEDVVFTFTLGESGSGKTTLGLAFLELVVSGSITFDGRDLQNLRGDNLRRLRSDLQVVFQDPYSSQAHRVSNR